MVIEGDVELELEIEISGLEWFFEKLWKYDSGVVDLEWVIDYVEEKEI